MERMLLEAEVRPALTKGERNQIRREDKVPAVVYGRGRETQSLIVEGKPLRQLLIAGGSNVLVELKVKEKGKKGKQETVMFKDIERHLFHKDKVTHVDFIRISMTDKIEVAIQLLFTGEPAGVKGGGILQVIAREVTVKCLPGDIPESLEVDLAGLSIGDGIAAGSLKLPEDVELISAPDELLVQILAPAAEEEGPAAEAEAAEVDAVEKEETEAPAQQEE